MNVLFGRCDEEAIVPYQPFVQILADLRREPGHERILLRGLDVDETEALLQVVAVHAVTPGTKAFTEVIHRETEGNSTTAVVFRKQLAATVRQSREAQLAGLRGQMTEAGKMELLSLFRLADMDAFRERLRLHRDVAHRLRDPIGVMALEFSWPAALAWMSGDAGEFDRLLSEAGDVADALGDLVFISVPPFVRGFQRMDQGRLAEVWPALAPLMDTLGHTPLMRMSWARCPRRPGPGTAASRG